MRLYSYWRSSCSYRVRIALAWKGIEHEIVPVHLARGEQNDETFRAKSPSRQVPLLVTDEGDELAQSIAILEYLEERFPSPPLLPSGAAPRARARQLAEIVNSGIQPLQNLFVTQELERQGVDASAWSVLHIRRGLEAYEAVARTTAGRFSIGDAPTLADACLVPQLYNARRYHIDVKADFPLLARIDAECAALPAFAGAHPDRQPDAPRE